MDWKQKSKKAISALLTASLIGSGMVMENAGSVVAAEEFDETNVVLRFGVLSDIHLSGLWNVEGSRQKLDRAYTGLELMAGENKLDAVFIDGDIVDAMNSSGNMSDSIPKLEQNYKEISAFRDISLNHFGGSDTKIIYANGNHDTADGVALDENKKTDTTGFWSSKLYQKILAGYMWSASVPGNASATAWEIADYNKEQIKAYNEKDGENYAFFYGSDEYLGANGLDYGNRHVVVGGYHFLTVEPKDYSVSYRDETVEWLDKTLAEITSAEPDKAVFVATHARVTNTIFGSLGSVTRQLVPTLNKYPQVILWGGHEHSALNRELAIWQDGFTAVDAGVVQYLYSADFGYYANSANPVNGVDYGGWGGTEYRKASQGEYVEVDGNGNVRIKRLDFYNSDLASGEVKVIGKPWEILGTKADGSHLTKYTEANRADGNTAPVFPSDAKLSVALNENLATVTFPAASDDIRVISYFVTVEQNGAEVTKQELTSFYYDCADASVLNDRTYTANELKCPMGDSVIKVTAIDDYGATAVLSADVTVEGEVSYPSSEFDLKNLNKNGWSGSTNKGTLTHGMTFDGRTGVSVITKSEDNKNSNDQIIMNNYSELPGADLSQTPYMLIDYYYAHDTASAKSAATRMRWRFFIKAENNKCITNETGITTNKWTTAIIPLTDSSFSNDGNRLRQYKFDPFGTTALRDIDDNDTMYISGIRFVHEEPTVFTENGISYASSDGYIKGVGAKVAATIDGAIKNLGTDGGKVLVEGDMIVTDAADLEKAGTARKSVTVMGYGEDLAARQKNRLWFQKTSVGRDAAYNGDITYDEITLKAPIDEAGVFSQGATVTFGENLLTEKTVKGNTDIDATGDKNISLDFGAYYNQNGDSNFIVNGGNYGRVATIFTWIQGNASAKINAHYILRGGNFNVVYSGARNSTTGVLTNTGNVTYDFEGGTFNNVYTGHLGFGKVTGLIRYNVTGGTFPKGIIFGSEGRTADKSQVGNTVVRIDGASVILSGNDKLSKVNDTDKWIAIENHAENGKVTFGESLTADYKIKVYGGEADAVFENGVLSGFTIKADNGSEPLVNGTALTAENGLYDLSAYEGQMISVTFSSELKKSRMQNFYWALQNKEKVNVAYLGGSVTVGYNSSDIEKNSWRGRVGQWLKDNYGEEKVNNIAAAIGSTGSYFGSYRVNQDAQLESENVPDLLFIEFAINDIYDSRTKEQVDVDYESIILQAYKANPKMIILPVFTMDMTLAQSLVKNGTEGSWYFDEERAIAAYYNLDTLNIGRALVDVISADYAANGKEMQTTDISDADSIWRKYVGDSCHPTDSGHKIYADTIIEYLNSQLNPALAAVDNNEYADIILPEPYCKSLGLEKHLKLNGHYISFKDAGFTSDNFYGWKLNYTDSESVLGDSNGTVVTEYNESSFAFSFKGTAVGFYNHGKPTSGKINYKITAIDDPSVTYLGATDLRKNYPTGLSFPGELMTGLDDREWKVECIMKNGGDGIVADLRYIYIDGDTSTIKPLTPPESYIPNLTSDYASVEFDITQINKDNWSASTCKGVLTHGVSFEGREDVTSLTKAPDNMSGNDEIIMNYVNFGGIDRVSLEATPYMVIDYYYAHDDASEKAAAPSMQWRFFIKAKNNKQVTKEAALETNRWATAVIPLTDADFAADDYLLKQYKFNPYKIIPTKDLDDNDTMYISGIRFAHDIPTVTTENGIAYVSPDGYIENNGAKISATIAEAMKTLGANGGTIYVEGDVVVTDALQIEEAGSERKPVTVKGYGEDLVARQKNRVWFQKTDTVRKTPFNGEIMYDEITLKAPVDEAGIFSNGVTVTLGENVLTENTVKNNTTIDASGDKNMTLNLGGYSDQSGKNTINICGGSYGDISTSYAWNPGNSENTMEPHYSFFGGKYNNVFAGARNSAGGVFTNKGNVTYDFVGGTFNDVYTGHYANGKNTGVTRFNVSGGTFTHGIMFGSRGGSADKSQVGNTVVRIDGASVILSGNDKLSKVNDTDKWIAIENHAENGKATFGESLTADYKIKVYGGKADAVFENGVLSGFTIASDGGYAPIVDGKILTAQNGVYDLSAYEGKTTEIYFNELSVDPEFSEEGAQNEKLTVRGAQIRITGEDYALRFVGILGSNLKDKLQKPASDKDTALGYGFVVYPVELLGENELSKETSGAVVVPAVKTFREEDDHIEFTVCVTGITTDKFNRYYAVRPYVTYTDSFGIERTVYGECYKNASLLSVAKMIPESDPSYSWVKENILDKAE